jgi:hypothetical protein
MRIDLLFVFNLLLKIQSQDLFKIELRSQDTI